MVRRENHKDEITVQVEGHPDTPLSERALSELLGSALKPRVTARIVPPGTLERDAKPLVDTRTWE
ncbi:MAG: hypothetical protein ACE5JI_11440 [Acidobacteriota bacterium]